ncbi:lysoplasmalogenase [Scandinavium sp. V105_16]|uniref:Lysoplasmalogenase n=1 Tax=Scandinavium lactucae TaxID=3095028 RepID=A0AAJ2VT68_9ENTR|nr:MULTISPECIES: lysoplasmalogenase [unclassified Scandinavium]MDX6019381.1 lysoplasmalogenase [Scandinavium sp. V105_16]MDX6030463.1 lysoplasmalogenase [Scandinavium sp. V105_12]
MLWSFIAVCLSGWLYVDASYRGPVWQRWVFKPVTLILLLLLAWQAPMFNAISYLVLAGLCASLIGDALTLLSRERLLYAIGAFFLSHLLYTIWFASQMTLSFFWPLPLVLVVIGALLIAVIWSRLEELRLPICTFIAMTLVMVWLAGELWFFRPVDTALSSFLGATLLLVSNIVWLGSHYRRRFRADTAIASACYFAGHFLIVRALYL